MAIHRLTDIDQSNPVIEQCMAAVIRQQGDPLRIALLE